MGRWITRFWENPHEGGLRRRDRRSGEYRAYVPDPLVGAALVLSPGTEALAARAEARVRALGALPDMAGIARFLLRSEAIASSRIEGVAPSAHRVALAELAQQEEVRGLSEQARAVARNVTLVRAAAEELSGARPVTADRLLALHRSLLPDSPEHHGIRSTQKWVGGLLLPPAGRRLRAAAARAGAGSRRGSADVPQRRHPCPAHPGGARARPVRDDPPLRGRQRPGGAGAHPHGADAPGAPRRHDSADEPGPVDAERRVRRGAVPLPRDGGPRRAGRRVAPTGLRRPRRAGRAGRSGRTGRTGKVGRSERAQQTGRTGRVE